MELSAAASVPGSFLLDVDQPVLSPLDTADAKSPLFQPPQTSSTSSSLLNSACSATQSSVYSASDKRKRARYDKSPSPTSNTPTQITQADWNAEHAPLLSSASFSATSPTSFVNTDYRLAGGLDTPTAASAAAHEIQDDYGFELYHRPSRYAQPSQRDPDGYFPRTPNTLSRERHARGLAQSLQESQGWGGVVFSLVTGVAGKLFDFCWNSAFRGFHAGVGQGYSLDLTPPVLLQQSKCQELTEKEDVFRDNYKGQRYRGSATVPGHFPDQGVKDYRSRSQAQGTESSTPNTFDGGGDSEGSALAASWVMVRDPVSNRRDGSPSCSSRKIPRRNTVTQPRPASRASIVGRPQIASASPSYVGSSGLESSRTASYASPRRQSQRQTITASPRSQASIGHRHSTSSNTSPRRSESRRSNLATPTSPEVKKFENKVRKTEKEAEESMQRLNQQLKNMIREGKQALGTRIQIEDDTEMEDEGYGEGTEMMGDSKW